MTKNEQKLIEALEQLLAAPMTHDHLVAVAVLPLLACRDGELADGGASCVAQLGVLAQVAHDDGFVDARHRRYPRSVAWKSRREPRRLW